MSKKIIDSHIHLWTLSDFYYNWPPADARLRRDFVLADYHADRKLLLEKKNVDIVGSVYVQVLNIEAETEKIIELSKSDSIIRGIVGWTDLTSENVDANIKRLKELSEGKLVGFRHLMQDEEPNWIVRSDVKRGLKAISDNSLAYDLQYRPNTIKHTAELATELPDLNFVIDHIGKPRIQGRPYDEEWSNDIAEAAKYPNVYCKLSGLVTESPEDYSPSVFEPHVTHVLDNFGWERSFFGADWPLYFDHEGCEFTDVYEIVNTIVTNKYSKEENFDEIWNAIFHDNAVKAYRLQ